MRIGDVVTSVNGAAVTSLGDARERLAPPFDTPRNAPRKLPRSFVIETAGGRPISGPFATRRRGACRSIATQLYAAIDAGLLALVLWFFYPFRRRDGEVFALLITVHPVSRFLLEMIRSDEDTQFNTGLTIAQLMSIGICACGVALWIYLQRQPRGSVLPLTARSD